MLSNIYKNDIDIFFFEINNFAREMITLQIEVTPLCGCIVCYRKNLR